MKLEVVVIPVSDVDRAKRFYRAWDGGSTPISPTATSLRVVQLTPPGSPCSIHFGKGVTTAAPGSAQDMLPRRVRHRGRTRRARSPHGAEVSEVFHFDGDSAGARRAGAGPRAPLLQLVRLVQRSRRQRLAAAGDQDAASRARPQPGRRDADRAPARDRGAPWRVRADRSEAPLVRLVRRLHRRARARQDSRRGSEGSNAPYRRRPGGAGIRLSVISIDSSRANRSNG